MIAKGGKDDPAENPAADNPKLGLSDTFSWLIGSYIDVQDPIGRMHDKGLSVLIIVVLLQFINIYYCYDMFLYLLLY